MLDGPCGSFNTGVERSENLRLFHQIAQPLVIGFGFLAGALACRAERPVAATVIAAGSLLVVAFLGFLFERFILEKLRGNVLSKVLVTLGIAYMIADFCLVTWVGDPIPIQTSAALQAPLRIGGFACPAYRLAVETRRAAP